MSEAVRHLYVHLPFCAHRCGYCDFVTVVGRRGQHAAYVDALLHELELEQAALASPLETIFLGGGTPTFTDSGSLARLLAALPRAAEVTVEANPETVSAPLAQLLREHGVNRVSLGAQSFQPHLLEVLERRARATDVRRAFYVLRDAGFDNINLDLLYGIPGQSAADLNSDLDEALALGLEHISYYELEAKPGTRFTHVHGTELARQAEGMETYFELVVERLTVAGYRWYETANFCLAPDRDSGRDLRAGHNLAYWQSRDYIGLGIGAVSTLGSVRRRNAPKLGAYIAALAGGDAPPRQVEPLDDATRRRERVMLGLRLDEPLELTDLMEAMDPSALLRLEQLGLVRHKANGAAGGTTLSLTERGRFVGGAVTADLLR